MVDLLKHNEEAYEKVKSLIEDGQKKIAVSHATGTGKSYLIAKLFEDYSNDKKLVLVPSTYISDQIQALFEKYNIQNVEVILYQKLIKMSDEDIASMDSSIIALDEYHHDTSKVWGEKVRTLIDTHPESIIFGTSATPIRSDGINTIDELFEGNCASDLPLSESIAKKIVPLPKYVGALYTLDDELEKLRQKVENATNTSEEKQEFYKKINTMRSQIEKSYGMPIILNKHIKNREGKYIIFCKKKKHLREIKDTVIGWFKTAGFKNINAYEVYSDYENKDAEYKAFCDDTSHNLKLLFCVNMLNEGLHLENISGVLLLRPTRSMIVFLQQIGRAIEANNANTSVIIDAVNNFSSASQGMGLLKEIKDAITKEKESDSDFDDSEFEDIDTFFVVEQVVEIREMFKEIEGRLEGSWDLYIKALKQYKEREGDCLASRKHIEVVNGVNIKLGAWIGNMRCEYKKAGSDKLTEEKKIELNRLNFIWDERRYVFENNIRKVSDYYNRYGKYPSVKAKDLKIRKLGIFICKERTNMRKGDYQGWKIKIINEHLPAFNSESISDLSFKKFIFYLEKFKNQYGHVDIKQKCEIDGYHIGSIFSNLKQQNISGTLSKDKKKKLLELGLCIENKFDENFNYKMVLAKQAINDGIVISKTYQEYRGINLKNWISQTVRKKYIKNELSKEEIHIIEELVKKPINKLFNNGNYVKIVDILDNKDIAICSSYNKAVVLLNDNFNLKVTEEIIFNRMNGKVKSPYKKRFMFYPVDDETIRKICTNNIKQLIFVQDK